MGRRPNGMGPWQDVMIDLIGEIRPPSEEGYRYIVVLVCRCLRMFLLVGCKSRKRDEVIDKCVELILRSRRIPVVLSTDNGPELKNALANEVKALLGVDGRFTTP